MLTWRLVRFNNRVPSRLSSARTCLLAMVGDMSWRSAAAVKLLSSTTVQNKRRLSNVSMIVNLQDTLVKLKPR